MKSAINMSFHTLYIQRVVLMQNSVGQQNIQQYQTLPMQCQCQPAQNAQAPQVQIAGQPVQAQPVQNPQVQIPAGQAQNLQVPNYSGVNIQIFNPTVTPPGATAPVYNVNSPNYAANPSNGCYPSNYYTNQFNPNDAQDKNSFASDSSSKTTEKTDKKTEKREIVQLTDEYIKNLENYLDSQDKEVRLMGAKEVVARLEEDSSRKDDKALNALINKMLQDPSTPVRILAMSALNSRAASGDELTVQILKQMQNSASGYGQDALQASEILLKMSGQKVEKEFEVKDTKKTETKETKTTETSNKG